MEAEVRQKHINEMLKIIDSACDYESLVKGLNEWAENRMKNGIMDLPEGLSPVVICQALKT